MYDQREPYSRMRASDEVSATTGDEQSMLGRGSYGMTKGRLIRNYLAGVVYHKLPGGGVEAGENTEEALRRECLEEVGCEIEIGKYLGEVVEYRANIGGEDDIYTLQISKCYRGRIRKKGEANFTESEKENDFSCRWVSLEEAIHILETDEPKNLEGRFIIERELTFLRSV